VTRFRIGVLTDLSSLYTDLSGAGSVLAARMAVEDFNPAARGFNVEIVSADHQNRADVGSTTARGWYDRDGVDAIVDVPNSSVVLAVNQITREKNKVMIVSSGATTDLTGPQCSPNSVHWTYDTFSQPAGTARAMVAAGGDSWFLITADYAFGHSLEADTERFVVASGGRVLGKVRHPFPGTDFSSFLLQAQSSRAKVIGLCNAGGDFINSVKQAGEFGLTRRGQNLAGLLVFITDVHGLGLETAQGLALTTASTMTGRMPAGPSPSGSTRATAAYAPPWRMRASMPGCCTTSRRSRRSACRQQGVTALPWLR